MAIHILTDAQLNVLKISGFIERYQFYLSITSTYKEAYEKTEKEYFQILGENKYKSYQSFLNQYRRYRNIH